MDRAPSSTEIQAVSSEPFFFRGVYRTRARIVRLPVQPLPRCRSGEKCRRGPVAKVDETYGAIHSHAGREHPLRARNRCEIFRTELIAHEPNISNRVATRRSRSDG